jgi:hypothetical protein
MFYNFQYNIHLKVLLVYLGVISSHGSHLKAYIAVAEEKLRVVQVEKQYKSEGTVKSPSQETA